jgi:hypothetical protein
MSQPQDAPRRLKQKRRRAKQEAERQLRKLEAANANKPQDKPKA